MYVDYKTIPGTARQRVYFKDGRELERQFVYAEAETWKKLKALCSQQKATGSCVIERLINLAYASYPGIQKR